MKTATYFAALFTCLSLVACDQAPSRNNQSGDSATTQNQNPFANLKSYRFNSAVDQCDTYQRSFQTQLEMCYAVQVPELNNNDCAKAERLAFYQQNCASVVPFDENQAREKIIHVDGNAVDCTLNERGLDTIRHFTGTNLLIMEHTSTRAVINHIGVDGKISLRLSLRDINTNVEIARIQKTWQDEAESLTLTAPSAMGSPVLTCLVSLAQDPDRE